MSYLVRSRACSRDSPNRGVPGLVSLNEIWEAQKRSFTSTSDPAWMILAYSGMGEQQPFINRFGERIEPETLAAGLLERLAGSWRTQPCAGFHHLQALAILRTKLRAHLSAATNVLLDDRWSDVAGKVEVAWRPDGHFDLKTFLGEPPPPKEAEAWELYVLGHVLELAMMSQEERMLQTARLESSVAVAADLVQRQPAWKDPRTLFTDASPFDYGAAAHLVGVLRSLTEPGGPLTGAGSVHEAGATQSR